MAKSWHAGLAAIMLLAIVGSPAQAAEPPRSGNRVFDRAVELVYKNFHDAAATGTISARRCGTRSRIRKRRFQRKARTPASMPPSAPFSPACRPRTPDTSAPTPSTISSWPMFSASPSATIYGGCSRRTATYATPASAWWHGRATACGSSPMSMTARPPPAPASSPATRFFPSTARRITRFFPSATRSARTSRFRCAAAPAPSRITLKVRRRIAQTAADVRKSHRRQRGRRRTRRPQDRLYPPVDAGRPQLDGCRRRSARRGQAQGRRRAGARPARPLGRRQFGRRRDVRRRHAAVPADRARRRDDACQCALEPSLSWRSSTRGRAAASKSSLTR